MILTDKICSSKLFEWCLNEASKVDFLTKDEKIPYAVALYQATTWGIDH